MKTFWIHQPGTRTPKAFGAGLWAGILPICLQTKKQFTHRDRGFTLIELLVVIVIIAILAALLLPALAVSRPNLLAVVDMNNKKKLQFAWTMYASDHNGMLVQNADQSVTVNGTPSWIPSLNLMNWTTSPYNTNLMLLKTNALAPYCLGQFEIYTSPGDTYWSPLQRALGYDRVFKHRVRSVAMDAAVGSDGRNHPADSGQIGYKPPGSLASLNAFFIATKTSQLIHPNKSWVFLDEDPDSIDDGIFYIDPRAASGTGTFIEAPASYLGGACGISFADGHVEVHHWLTSAFNHQVSYSKYPATPGLTLSGNVDLAWLAQRTPSGP